jgi:hypothetical protein
MAGITTGADGSIHIDTRIDTSGVNTGTKQISKTIEKNVAKPAQNLTKSLSGVLSIIKSIGKALIAAFVGGAIIGALRNIVQEFDLLTGSGGEKFKALGGALETLKGAFVNLLVQAILPLVPYLIQFVDWLTSAVQFVTQLVAALFGFESTVGGIMTKAASGAQKAAKAAKGALAAFDQINVLQQKETPAAAEGATATPGPINIPDDILKKIETLKKLWDAFLKDPLGVLVAALIVAIGVLQEKWRAFIQWVRDNLPFGNAIADILTIIGETLRKLIVNFIETVLKVKENVLLIFQGIKDFLTGVFTGDWALAWEGIKEIVSGVFGAIFAIVEGILNHIGILLGAMVQYLQVIFAPVLEFFGELFEKVKGKVAEVILSIQTTFAALAKWFTENIFNPIANGFLSALTTIKQGFQTTFNGIRDFVKGTINSIIDFLNRMIDGVVNGINAVIGAANAVAGLAGLPEISLVAGVRIPRLATGAVIPPNSEFLAVLGDQRNGRNIEAPEGLIRQIIQEEIGRIQADIRIGFDGNLGALVRELKPRIDKENVRIGGSLIKSGATTS